ncbi:hypothetical protein ACIBEK_08635 [Nocardia fusca]|uniref:hypothetical protein n=1 Tax=Nocardia fusca TaxID=941183 RepID=UPI00378774B5
MIGADLRLGDRYPLELDHRALGCGERAHVLGQRGEHVPVRLPTARLDVQLSFPAALDPVVGGIETSPTTGARPFGTPPALHHAGDLTRFT